MKVGDLVELYTYNTDETEVAVIASISKGIHTDRNNKKLEYTQLNFSNGESLIKFKRYSNQCYSADFYPSRIYKIKLFNKGTLLDKILTHSRYKDLLYNGNFRKWRNRKYICNYDKYKILIKILRDIVSKYKSGSQSRYFKLANDLEAEMNMVLTTEDFNEYRMY
jgi:hypothetical protein